jgi:hypothetical protein
VSAALPELIGLWRLVSARREFADNGEVVFLYGADARGYLLLAPGGRMMALLTGASRPADDPVALFRGMMAYSGAYRVDGDRWITDVDVAWHPDWQGSRQERFFRIDGDDLHITTAPQTHPSYPDRLARGILHWRREDPLTRPVARAAR